MSLNYCLFCFCYIANLQTTSYFGLKMGDVNVKLVDIIKQYSGDSDFCEWNDKLELVAQLQGIQKLETFLPLFLSGGAFVVYKGMSDDVKSDYRKLKEALVEAFSVNPLVAYNEFVHRRLASGESVDVFLADLQRLGSLVGKDNWIKLAFIGGLPEETQRQIKAMSGVYSMDLSEVVARARALVGTGNTIDAAAAGKVGVVYRERRQDSSGPPKKCFGCGDLSHFVRSCPKRIIKCYSCGEEGHIASSATCPNKSKN